MVVPPKHPKMIIISRKTHGCWVPALYLGNPHMIHEIWVLLFHGPAAGSYHLIWAPAVSSDLLSTMRLRMVSGFRRVIKGLCHSAKTLGTVSQGWSCCKGYQVQTEGLFREEELVSRQKTTKDIIPLPAFLIIRLLKLLKYTQEAWCRGNTDADTSIYNMPEGLGV